MILGAAARGTLRGVAAIVVAGGSVAGLATALFASRAGYQVTVIEQDASAPPDSVEDVWRSRVVHSGPHIRSESRLCRACSEAPHVP
jgi:glycine/D-amino acid oxidase-like deaminating enzyme